PSMESSPVHGVVTPPYMEVSVVNQIVKMNREECIKLVEESYFGNVVRGDIDAVLDCFTENAKVTIRHGDRPVRRFSHSATDGDCALRDFYQHLCGNYVSWFGEFEHYIDTTASRSACTFTVKLDPRQSSPYFNAGTQILQNCNFFCYEGNRISDMTIYYSNSAEIPVGTGRITPTGYPPENLEEP
ncbi:MAG: hypothetical protein ACE5GZ_07700, partial [Gammaproteobacteria bacterium]